MTRKIYLPDINISLDEFVDEYAQEYVYYIKSVLNEDNFKVLREFIIQRMVDREYFECVIGGEFKKVRFGIISHSKTDEGYIVEGPIVEKEYDEKDEDDTNHLIIYQSNINTQVIKTEIILERLLGIMVEKELISVDQKNKILNVSRREILEKNFDYNFF